MISLSVSLVFILLLLISIEGLKQVEQPEILTMREVKLNKPPPPPPPPDEISSSSNRDEMELKVTSMESPVILTSMELDVQIPSGQLTGLGGGGWGKGIGVEGIGFSLSELDYLPTVIFDPLFQYPEELTEQGVMEFAVQVHILIDENGQTVFKGIVSNPYPRFDNDIRTYVSNVRFSPPTISGVRVKAEYLWPLKLRSSPQDI